MLQRAVQQYYTKAPHHTDTTAIHRIEIAVPNLDPFQWLDAQPFEHKLYWSGRDDQHLIAAAGIADCQQSTHFDALEDHFTAIQTRVETAPEARYFGGIRFATQQPADAAWHPFGAFHFVLPRFELHRRPTGTHLVYNLVFPQDASQKPALLSQIQALQFPTHDLQGDFAYPLARLNEPTEPIWKQKIDWLLHAFTEKVVLKTVLARKASFSFDATLNPVLLLKRLQYTKPHCFHFFYQPRAGTAFVAATPERLYYREGTSIFSEAVAGTRSLTHTPVEQAAKTLLASEKDQREHAYVRQSVAKALAKLCDVLGVDPQASIMKLARRVHLFSQISGTLKPQTRDVDLIRALHPTPAVGGFPTQHALQTIAQLESFDRGWYAGPIGWISAKAAEFAVGIRSGLVQGQTLSLFSGAGIVEGSTPESEWQEIEEKISDFLAVLGLNA